MASSVREYVCYGRVELGFFHLPGMHALFVLHHVVTLVHLRVRSELRGYRLDGWAIRDPRCLVLRLFRRHGRSSASLNGEIYA